MRSRTGGSQLWLPALSVHGATLCPALCPSLSMAGTFSHAGFLIVWVDTKSRLSYLKYFNRECSHKQFFMAQLEPKEEAEI